MRIYAKRSHLIATFFIIAVPFFALLAFAATAHINLANLWVNVIITIIRLFVAYLIAVVLAWIFATLFHRGKAAAVALPVFDVLQSFPTFAILPLATFYLGATNFTVILFMVITVIWPILFSIISSLKLIKHDWEEAVEIYQLKKWDYVTKFVWPASLPGLITGSIIGLGDGWEAIVGTEIIVGIKSGMGNFFQMFSQNALVTCLGVIGLLALIFSINKVIWIPLLDWSHKVTEE